MEMSAETENKDQLNYSGELQDLSNSGVTDAPSSKSAGKEGEKSRAPYSTSNDPNMLDVVSGKPCKLSYKVLIPVDDFPKFNFVGKILGPKGNSLKRLQEETGTRMAVLGRGSMRDKSKEEQLRQEGGKYSHLNEPLHVWIEAYAQPSDALARLAHAVAEVKKYLNPDYNDDIRQQQLEELVTLGEIPDRGRGLARGMGHMRGGPVGPAMSPRGLPPRPAPPVRGMPMPPRGSMPMRPGLSRGAMPMSRGSPASARPPMSAPRTQNEYYDYGHREGGSDGYGYEDGYSGPGSASGYGKAPPSVRGRGDYRPRPY